MAAAVTWWLETTPQLTDVVRESLQTAAPERFTSMHEWDLGTACGDAVSNSDTMFWAHASKDPGVRHMLEQAARAWKVTGGLAERVQAARRFARHLVHCEAGRMVRASGFLERNAVQIRQARRQKAKRR